MFCEQCGTQIEDGKRLCQKCINIQKNVNNTLNGKVIVLIICSVVFVIILTAIVFFVLLIIYVKFIIRLMPEGSQAWSFPIILLASVVLSILSCILPFKKIKNKISKG